MSEPKLGADSGPLRKGGPGRNHYATVEQAVLRGDALDAQFVNRLLSYPLVFGLAMMPDVRCLTADGEIQEVEAENLIEQAEREEWRFDIDYQQLLFLVFW